VNFDMEKAYVDNCNRFKVVCEKFPKFLEYVKSTILGPVKEKIMRFWVNKVMHMRNTTTNRAESTHMLESQHTQIHASFQKSIIMLEHRFKGKSLWSRLI